MDNMARFEKSQAYCWPQPASKKFFEQVFEFKAFFQGRDEVESLKINLEFKHEFKRHFCSSRERPNKKPDSFQSKLCYGYKAAMWTFQLILLVDDNAVIVA